MWKLLIFVMLVGAVLAALKKGKKQSDWRDVDAPGQRKDSATAQAAGDDGTYEAWKGSSPKTEDKRTKYRDKFQLLNGAEIALYNKLVEAVPALLVFSQVSMSQVFHIKGNTNSGYRQLGEIGRKSIDFLLCRKDDTSIVLAIELNGRYHEREKQKASDEKKRAALEDAGIPLLVLKPSEVPDVAGLRKLIAPHIVGRKKYEAERDEKLQR